VVRAVITGINGQDGRLLSEKLISKGYSVFGIANPKSEKVSVDSDSIKRINLDLSDQMLARDFFSDVKPELVFHLAAVHASSSRMKIAENIQAESMMNCHIVITENILKWQLGNPSCKSVIALSSQMFRNDPKLGIIIDEKSTPNSANQYGATKARAWELVKYYRKEYGVKTAGAILFNHASIYSKPEFLFRELAQKIAMAKIGKSTKISVRNPSAFIDMTSAQEICTGIHLMSMLNEMQDFVLGSGKSIQISDIVSAYSEESGDDIEVNLLEENFNQHCLISSISNAKEILGWQPKITPSELLATIVGYSIRNENHVDGK